MGGGEFCSRIGDERAHLFRRLGGEGTLRVDGRDMNMMAGSFGIVPRGMSYSLTRRGRNVLIILATLAGEPCS